ncbi:MAG: DNA topoisomerase III [Oscillospiraceae bacterium]|nr:DNA topoisomerase III [Oscillospiraceae bacterium]
MSKSLVLAEKPSVAKEIAKTLGCRQNENGCISGGKYIITWALGHLVTLADPESYGEQYKSWNLESLPILPPKMELVVIKETSKQFKIVRELLSRADISEVIIATDAGREGELVARWILLKSGCKKPAKRLWISSQTDKAIQNGFASLKPASDYDNLFLSASARAEADWLVGFNVTRALTCKHNAQLSAGRVQTPTLALIAAREQEIRSFVPKDYFLIRAKLDGFSAVWRGKDGQSRIFDHSAAEKILAGIAGKRAEVSEISKQYKSTPPPAAYDLTELQRDANKKYSYSAKQTLSIMQSLYEYHKIVTYPRTDSRYITSDVAATLGDRLRGSAVGNYAETARALQKSRPFSTRWLVNDKLVTDHHAIIPTEEPVNLSALSPEERNIFDLVVKRFFAVLSPAFEYEETKLTLAIGQENFYAKGKIVKAAGWKSIYGSASGEDDEGDEGGGDESETEQNLPQIKKGDRLDVKSCAAETKKTKPPPRYTEATLLSAMEDPSGQIQNKALRETIAGTSGLGTSATRADIIEKLFSSFYVERAGKEIVPTSKGIQLVSIVPPDLKSAELTAKWEQQLNKISKGEAKRDNFIAEMKKYSTDLVAMVAHGGAKYIHDNMTRQKCPECGKFLLEVSGKRGKMLVCSERECGYRKNTVIETNARCPTCHKKLQIRGEGENRIFACICGHREKVSDFEKRRADAGASKADVKKYLELQESKEKAAPKNTALAEQLAKWIEQNSQGGESDKK